ncbi:MAG: hypothetical protein U0Q18_10365 [Bryobacteraceae bacterium]
MSPNFVDSEVLSGVVDGSNVAFTTAAAAAPLTSLAIYRNGMLLKAGQDFTISGSSVQFLPSAIPQPGDTLLASYRVTPAGAAQGPVAPLVLCSGGGTATSSTSTTTLGTCNIPAGALQPGDRVRLSFDYSHEGSFAGFTFIVKWGNTIVSQRSGSASDSLISGWAEAGVGPSSSQLTVQSWGTVLSLGSGILSAGDSIAYPLALTFQAKMASAATDTATLRNFTVVRYPKVP